MTNSNYITKIIKGCKKGKPKSQQAFVQEFSSLLYGICRRYINDEEFAKDMLQEILFRALDKIKMYEDEKGKIESWISTITIRTCLNWLQKKRIRTVDVEEIFTEEVQFDARILQDLSLQELYSLIHHLPIKYKEVFNLHVIDGYSHEEIGEFLGIETVSSRTRLHRAKEILRKKIERIKKQESCIITT